MPDIQSEAPQLFTKTSAGSLAAVATVGLVAYLGSKTLLAKNAKWQDRFTFVWIVGIGFFERLDLLLIVLWDRLLTR